MQEDVMHRVIAFTVALFTVLGLSSPAVAAPQSFTVEVSGKGAPVILIPGLACGGKVWDSTVARYRKSHELHVLTLAGFAGTTAIDGPLLPTVRTELAAYIREHELHKPIVVGHSLGGFMAMWLAATEPDLLGGVVAVDSLPFFSAAFDPQATEASVKPKAEMMRQMLSGATPEAFAAQNHRALTTMITDPKNIDPIAEMGKKTSPKAAATAVYEIMTTDLRPLLPKVRVPALVIAAGQGEPVAETARQYEAQLTTLPGHKLVVAATARHFIMIDDPQFLFAQLDSALNEGSTKSNSGSKALAGRSSSK
jgi:N-formylmaleamate deformylase